MEYIDGRSITQYCREEQLGLRAQLTLFGKICAAVHYAHQQMVVHCDLKASNILVTPEGEPKLLDFGISKLLQKSDLTVANPQQEDDYRRLPLRYCSPEQLQGKPLGTPTDIYALGVILFELVADAPPRAIDEDDIESYSRAVISGMPPSPSVVAENHQISWAKQLQGDLDAIVEKAMATDPDSRYASVADLARDITSHLATRPVSARADTWVYHTATFLRRNRYTSSLGILLLSSLLVSSGLLAVKSAQVVEQRDRAEAQRDRALAVTGFLTQMFESGLRCLDRPITTPWRRPAIWANSIRLRVAWMMPKATSCVVIKPVWPARDRATPIHCAARPG